MSRVALTAVLAVLAACGRFDERELLAAAPEGGELFYSIETYELQIHGRLPDFLFSEGRQEAVGVSVPTGDGRAVHRWGLWRYFHIPDSGVVSPDVWGHLAARGHFEDGRRVGRWEFWYPDGSRRAEGTFVDNRLDGEWTVWTSSGEVDREHSGTYRAGAKID